MSNKARNLILVLVFSALFIWAPDAWLGFGFYDFHDLRHHHLPWRTWAVQEWGAGNVPLWAPIGTGFPLAAEAQAGVFYAPVMLIFALFSPSYALNLSILFHLAFSLWGMYLFTRQLSLSREASLFSAFAFAFGGLMSTHALYLGLFCCWAWLPWGLWAIWGRRYGSLLTSLSMMAVAGHPQAAVIAWTLVIGLGIIRHRDSKKGLLRIGEIVLLAVGISSIQWVSSLELSQFSLRDGGLSTAAASVGAMPLSELISVVFPYFFGFERPSDIAISYWHRGNEYWGAGINYWEMCCYVGGPTIVLSFWGRKSRLWAFLALLSLLLMLGDKSPLWWLLHQVPPFSFLRFPVRFSLGLVLALSVIAAHGFDHLICMKDEPRKSIGSKLILLSIVLTFCFGVLGWIWPFFSDSVSSILLDYYGQRTPLPLPDLPPEVLAAMPSVENPNPELRVQQIIVGLTKSLSPKQHLGGLLSIIVLGLLLRVKSYTTRSVGVIALLFVELYALGANYQERVSKPVWMRSSQTRQVIEEQGIFDRELVATVLRHQNPALDSELISSNLALMFGYDDVMVPSPLRLVRQESLLHHVGLGLGLKGGEAVRSLEENPALVDLLGVRYLLSVEMLSGYDLKGGDVVKVYQNPDILPLAWVVPCAKHVEDPWSALSDLEPRSWVMVESADLEQGCDGKQGSVNASVTILEQESQRLVFDVETTRAGILVIREAWYPGWKVKVNSTLQTVERVNWNFQGVAVNAGQSIVELSYAPWWLKPVTFVVFFSALSGLWLVRRWHRLDRQAGFQGVSKSKVP